MAFDCVNLAEIAMTGGLSRCEESFEQLPVPGYDTEVPLSREYNHRKLVGEQWEDSIPAQNRPLEGYWSRTPDRHEADEHNTPLGPAKQPELLG